RGSDFVVRGGHRENDAEVSQGHQHQHGDDVIKKKQRRPFPCCFLIREKVHGAGRRERQAKLTFGASFSSARSTTNNSAGVKLNMPAMMLVGNFSRDVLYSITESLKDWR